MLVDSHCHIDFAPAAERPGVIGRARAAGVGLMLNVAASRQSFDEVAGLAESYPEVLAAVGVHPEEIEDGSDVMCAEKLAEFARAHAKVVAIGETGLDYHYPAFDAELQENNLRAHIEAARGLGLPLIIHNRGSDGDMIRILSDEMGKGAFKAVLHCFASTLALAAAALEFGFLVSASGIIAFPNAVELRDIFKTIPLERLLVETDSPFLAPPPHRGDRNEPAFVVEVARKLAEIKETSLEEISRITTENFKRYFGLS